MNPRHGTLALFGTLALLAGCDEQSAPPRPVDERKPADPVPERPTTQALLEGPRKTLHLELIPFSIETPESWALTSKKQGDALPITIVEGPMPVDQGVISVHLRESITGTMMKTWLERIPKEDAEARQRGGSVTVREIGEVYVIERRRPFAPTTQPSTQSTRVSEPQGSMEWRLTILSPRGIKYEWYELKVLGLTDEMYRQNETFLTGLLQSLKPATPPPLPAM